MGETRREFLSSLAKWTVGSAAVVVTMGGCEEIVVGLAEECPDPDPIDWVPDVAHPVFFGYTDVDAAAGAPGRARIWYPTLDGTPSNAQILQMCLARWPVVLFLHGQPPPECRDYPEYFKRWDFGPVARSGYVVVVPELQREDDPLNPESANLALALQFLDWTRSSWEHSEWVSADATSTALMGHSFGVPVALQVAWQRPTGALVSFSYVEWDLTDEDIGRLTAPSMVMSGEAEFPQPYPLVDSGRWDLFTLPKYHLTFAGAHHFDYLTDLPGCAEERGYDPPQLMPRIAGELAALFLTRHVPVPLSTARVKDDLTLPEYELTREQEFYVGSHLSTIRELESSGIEGYAIDMLWQRPESEVSSRRIG